MATHIENIPQTMWAANVKEFHQPYTLEKVPVPQASSLDDHEILIKVAVASYCHTDQMVLDGSFHDAPSGTAGSHEPSGTIAAVGSQAAKKFALGDRVIAIGVCGPCGDCIDCIGPEEFRLSCKFTKGYVGITRPGAFAEYTVIDSRFTTKIPHSLGFVDAAPLTCAGATSWRAVKRSGVKAGGWLGIVGSGGGLGHLAIQFAVKSGINVVGVDARDVGLELTRTLGATAVDVRKGNDHVVAEVQNTIGIRQARGDDLCDATIVLSEAKSALLTGMKITKCHGVVVEVAQPERIDFPFQEMIFRDIRLMGSNLSSAQELDDQVAFVVEHGVKIYTTVFRGLEELPEVLAMAHDGEVAGKIVVVVDQTQI